MATTFQWRQCDANGANCTDIAGATSSTYAIPANFGGTLRVVADGVTSAAWPGVSTLGTAITVPRMVDPSVGKNPGDAGTSTVTGTAALTTALSGASAGLVIFCHTGTYNAMSMQNKTWSADGSNPVTVLPYPGESVTFSGHTSFTSAQNGYYFQNCSGLRIRGITFNCPFDNAVKIEDTNHIELDGVVIKNAGRSSGQGTGILVNSLTSTQQTDVQLWNSTLFNNGGKAGTGFDHQMYWGGGSVGGVTNWVIANNLIYDGPTGYNVQIGDQANNGFFVNNTVDHAFEVASTGNITIWRSGTNPTSNNQFVNNIISNALHWGIVGVGGANTTNHVRNNLLYNNASGNYTGSTYVVDSTASTLDPKFQDYANKNFHLSTSPLSPAKGAADPAYCPTTDAQGNQRSSSPSLGCFE